MRKIGVILCFWALLNTFSLAQNGQTTQPLDSPAQPAPASQTVDDRNEQDRLKDTPKAMSSEGRPRLRAPLERFGYSYFKQAREAITLRRLYFQMLLQGTLQSSQLPMAYPGQEQQPAQSEPTQQGSPKDSGQATPAPKTPAATNVTPQQLRTSTQTPTVAPSVLVPLTSLQPADGTSQQFPVVPYLFAPHSSPSMPGTFFVLPPADAIRNYVGPDAMMWMNVLTPTPERYQLGPGDVLTLRYWSETLEPREVSLRVDPQGAIALPSGGKVVARGQTLAQVEETVRKALSRVIRNVDVTLTLRALRTMTVIITGEAFAPGSYQMPAVATLFNALYACGGPNDNGSLRRIQLKRTDGSVHTFDFYRFLLHGDGSQDVPLQPGDVIFIPPVEVSVSISGEVTRPAIYELLPNERLREAVALSGGVKPSGVAQRVAITSVRPGEARQLIDANLLQSDDANNPPLYDGDTVEVYSIRLVFANIITVEGAVDQPGNYALTPGMTVADLVERARGLLEDAYIERADLFRTNPDETQALIPIALSRALQRDPQANIPLQRRDRLMVYAMKDVEWMGDRRTYVRGAVQKPGTFYRADNMRVQDLLLQAGGVLPNAFIERAFLQRRNPDGSYGHLLAIDLRKAMLNDPEHNAMLQDRDTLMVYTREQAQFTPENVVTIDGAVQSPGTYPRAENMRLSDLIRLAGGPLPEAATRVEIAKARKPIGTPPMEASLEEALRGSETQNPLLEDGDVVTVRARGDFRLKPLTVYLRGAVKEPGPYTLQAATERLSDIVKRAGGLLETAYPQAARLLRRPDQVISEMQRTLTGRILKVLQIVNEEEYRRALARSDVERVRFAAGIAQPPTPASASSLLGQAATPSTSVSPERVAEVSTLLTRDLVSQARPLKDEDLLPAGNVRINMVAALQKPGSDADVEVRDGDIIFVPEKPTTVAVTGAVVLPSAVLYTPGKDVSFYVERAGGVTVDAARDKALVIRATGEVIPIQKVRTIELGDIIFVPTKVMAERLRDRQAEIEVAIRAITSGAIVYQLLRNLVQ